MKILSPAQIQEVDQATIAQEPIASIDLMERASWAFVRKLQALYALEDMEVYIFCGPGNNGGDGLAVARLLHEAAVSVKVWRCQIGNNFSTDNQENWQRLQAKRVIVCQTLTAGNALPIIPNNILIVDAIFGAGLSRPIEGYWAELIKQLNQAAAIRFSIDLPSGLSAQHAAEGTIFQAHHTITFELPKLACFAVENAVYTGQWEVISIGLSKSAIQAQTTDYHWLLPTNVSAHLKPRARFDHKGTYGHVLLVAGSFGKLGAAVLSAKAILRSGAGLVTCHLPRCGYEVMQIAFPEAMVSVDEHQLVFSRVPTVKPYQAIGIGPGLGQDPVTVTGFKALLQQYDRPMVIDADALNILSKHKELLRQLPSNSILTPHPKEFERLFGATVNSFQRWEVLRDMAQQYKIYIILKGGYTAIASPNGQVYFATVGNPGMATAGAGDVLTGIVSSLLAQGYTPLESCQLGVYIHGTAGDLFAKEESQQNLLAEDIIAYLGKAFQLLQNRYNK